MSRYTYVWEFDVATGLRDEFERHYGPDGSWVRLFQLSSDYIETLLLKDHSQAGRYLTVDRWRSEHAYRAFRSAYAKQYDLLDRDCESLTARETLLGEFTECVASPFVQTGGASE